MSYIRHRKEEKTGYQENAPFDPKIDLQCDFVMVYGIDASMPERVQQFMDQGYVVHLMTGSAWGQYQDYLNGIWDGRDHWDESQMDRNGDPILHGVDVPYIVPTIAYCDYLTMFLKRAVDAGVAAIHLEEPEFWDHGGYSEAFKREYALYYRQPWTPPHESLDVRYKASKLKAYLYARLLDRVGSALKEYAQIQYDRILRIYVPTHSLLNYTQWKIMSPEAALIDIPAVDGYIAQVWTGTSRCPNIYQGAIKSRTFETAYLEYGAMQELTRGTGRRMWFLHDPIEDNPSYTWDDYRENYLETVVASLLHPAVHDYECCPWPRRVFHGIYPQKPKIGGGMMPGGKLPGAKSIPIEYATLIASNIQMLGDMEQTDCQFAGTDAKVGVFMSDSGLYQRTFPDTVVSLHEALDKKFGEYTQRIHSGEDCQQEMEAFLRQALGTPDGYHQYLESASFPSLFGLAMPLLKEGLPVRPVQLDNVLRFPGYLDEYDYLILSYEHCKPSSPALHYALADWVRQGGTLLYVGDGSDPYHQIHSWWNRSGQSYRDPALHLMALFGLNDYDTHTISSGQGQFSVWNMAPARITVSSSLADEYRTILRKLFKRNNIIWHAANHLTLHRGPYIIVGSYDECSIESPIVLNGLFADMLTNDYSIIHQKVVQPGENAILFDLSKIQEPYRIIGTSARIQSLDIRPDDFEMHVLAVDAIHGNIRLRLPQPAAHIHAVDDNGTPVDMSSQWDEESRTLLLHYLSTNQRVHVRGFIYK